MNVDDPGIEITEIPTVPRNPERQPLTVLKPWRFFHADGEDTGGSEQSSQSEQLHTRRRSQTDTRTRVTTMTGKKVLSSNMRLHLQKL